MPSSTSNSDCFARSVPSGAWVRSAWLAALFALVLIGAWELKVRSEGYRPTLADSSDRWSLVRSKLGQEPKQTVIVGASRAQFDLDLETLQRGFGGPFPLQLAMPGTNPLALLEDIAEVESFDGLLIVGVTPGLWFVPEGMPVQNAQDALGRYRNWSPAQKVGLRIASAIQQQFAFINADDLRLSKLLDRLPLSNRAAAQANLPPALPAYFASMDQHRQAYVWDQAGFGSERARQIQRTWIPLFTPPPPPPHLSPEAFGEMMQKHVQATLERIRVAVEKLHRRGVQVVFVCPPSTGELRELEAKFTPRERFFDQIVATAGAPGVYFADHPELAAFDCPEWSHLMPSDAVLYTQRLVPILKDKLGRESGPLGRHNAVRRRASPHAAVRTLSKITQCHE